MNRGEGTTVTSRQRAFRSGVVPPAGDDQKRPGASRYRLVRGRSAIPRDCRTAWVANIAICVSSCQAWRRVEDSLVRTRPRDGTLQRRRSSTQALGILPDSRNRLVALFGILPGATMTGQWPAGGSLHGSLVPVLNEFSDTFSC